MTSSSLQQRQGYAKSKGMPTPPFNQDPAAPASSEPEAPPTSGGSRAKRPLPDVAARALAEAAARRNDRAGGKADPGKSADANEKDGRGGLDPTRYGDWEVNGLASDF
jgi:hypothetical protein